MRSWLCAGHQMCSCTFWLTTLLILLRDLDGEVILAKMQPKNKFEILRGTTQQDTVYMVGQISNCGALNSNDTFFLIFSIMMI